MNVDAAKAAHEALIKSGVNFVACLPDSAFQELYLPVSSDPKITYVQVASENDGVGVCMGAWLGGMKPALLVENTGFTLGTYALLRGPMAFVEKTEEVSAAISNAVKSMNSMQAPVAILFAGEILF